MGNARYDKNACHWWMWYNKTFTLFVCYTVYETDICKLCPFISTPEWLMICWIVCMYACVLSYSTACNGSICFTLSYIKYHFIIGVELVHSLVVLESKVAVCRCYVQCFFFVSFSLVLSFGQGKNHILFYSEMLLNVKMCVAHRNC